MGLKDRDFLEAVTNEALPDSKKLEITIPEDALNSLGFFDFTEDEISLINYFRHKYKDVISLLRSLDERGITKTIIDTVIAKALPEWEVGFYKGKTLEKTFELAHCSILSCIISKDDVALRQKQLLSYAIIIGEEGLLDKDLKNCSEVEKEKLFDSLGMLFAIEFHDSLLTLGNYYLPLCCYDPIKELLSEEELEKVRVEVPGCLSYLSAFMTNLGGNQNDDVDKHIQQIREICNDVVNMKTEEQEQEDVQRELDSPQISPNDVEGHLRSKREELEKLLNKYEVSESEGIGKIVHYILKEIQWAEEHLKEVDKAAEELTHLKELEDDYKEKYWEAPLNYSLLTDLQRINRNPKINIKKIFTSGVAGFFLGLILALLFRKPIISHCPFLWANSTILPGGSVYYEISKSTQSLVTLLIVLFSVVVFLGVRFFQERKIYKGELEKAKALEKNLAQLNEKQLAAVDARQKYFAYYDSIDVMKDQEAVDHARHTYEGTDAMPEAFNYNLKYNFINRDSGERILYESCHMPTAAEKSITESISSDEAKRKKTAVAYSAARVLIVVIAVLAVSLISKITFKVDNDSRKTDNDNGVVYSDDLDSEEEQVGTENQTGVENQTENNNQDDYSDAYFIPGETYYTQTVLRVREGPDKSYRQLSRDELSIEDYANSEDYPEACLKQDSPVICLEMSGDWMRIPSGWICVFDEGEELVK